jgi:hypothetical protein
MSDWIAANAGTLLVSAVLLVLVILDVLKMVRDRKQGKITCSMGCGGCPMSGTCHKKQEEKRKKNG